MCLYGEVRKEVLTAQLVRVGAALREIYRGGNPFLSQFDGFQPA